VLAEDGRFLDPQSLDLYAIKSERLSPFGQIATYRHHAWPAGWALVLVRLVNQSVDHRCPFGFQLGRAKAVPAKRETDPRALQTDWRDRNLQPTPSRQPPVLTGGLYRPWTAAQGQR